MINYFNQFFQYMAEYTSSLHQWLKKDTPWNWSSVVQAAFDKLRQLLVSLPTLATYEPSICLGLSCDAISLVL
jgi:hypothetical protein